MLYSLLMNVHDGWIPVFDNFQLWSSSTWVRQMWQAFVHALKCWLCCCCTVYGGDDEEDDEAVVKSCSDTGSSSEGPGSDASPAPTWDMPCHSTSLSDGTNLATEHCPSYQSNWTVLKLVNAHVPIPQIPMPIPSYASPFMSSFNHISCPYPDSPSFLYHRPTTYHAHTLTHLPY